MTTKDLPISCRGDCLDSIIARYGAIVIYEGTLLVFDAPSRRIYFQIAERYVYNGAKVFMKVLSGSAVNQDGQPCHVPFVIPDSVSLPSLEQEIWYEEQNTV